MRIIEFLEGSDGLLSITKLLSLLAFFPAAWVTVQVDDPNKITAMGILLGAYVLQSGVNTIGNAMTKRPADINVENIEKTENLTKTGNVNIAKGNKK